MNNFIILLFTILLIAGCTNPNTLPLELPDQYIKCEHTYENDKFKYQPKNATKYEDAFCGDTVCVDLYIIKDLEGNTWELSSDELENWVCKEISDK